MTPADRADIRYEVRYCALMRKTVWAVLREQADGRWHAVNCLDKHDACVTEAHCRFTAERGEWPFADAPGGA